MISKEKLDVIIDIINENRDFYENYVSYESIQAGVALIEELSEEQQREDIKEIVKIIYNNLERQSPYSTVWWYSVLISIDINENIFINFIKYIRNNQNYFSLNTRYFLYCQLKYIMCMNELLCSQNIVSEIKTFFCEIVNSFEKKISVSLERIPEDLRDDNTSLVIVSQFLDLNNNIEKSVLEKCKILNDVMKQKVLIVNTTEVLSAVGEVPFYNAYYSKCDVKKEEEEFQEYEGTRVPYFQCGYSMPSVEQIEIILKRVREIAPGCIISFGEESIFSALVNNIIPVVNENINIVENVCENKNYELISKLNLLETQRRQDTEVTDIDKMYNCFRKNFLKLNGDKYCEFNECSLDFYAYNVGKYCVYNKELQRFDGNLNILELKKKEQLQILKENCFSPITLEFDGDWIEYMAILKEALKRKIYVICSDIKKVVSYFKVPELKSYMENIKIFSDRIEYQKYFHKNINEYLPRIVFANDKRDEYQLKKIIRSEHKYRLTEEGRDTSNVLLTIGIPTHNRGNLLLKRLEKLLKLQYDAEIEIIVAKNGFALYQKEYMEASCIQDSRYIYYGTDEELKPQQNWYNVTKFAHGKYIVFVSDEDDLINNALEYYLNLLMTNDEVSIIRTRTTKQYADLKKVYGKKGLDAFSKSFLGQNYLSGLIVNNADFRKANVMKYEEYSNNKFYQNYPHEWWCAQLSFYGDYLAVPVNLIDERDAVLNEEYEEYERLGILKKEDIFDKNCGLPRYATYESRFEQFNGQIEFIKYFMKNNKIGLFLGLEKIINKLAVMLIVARNYGYKKEEYKDFIERFFLITSKCVDLVKDDADQKNRIEKVIQMNYKVLIQNKIQCDGKEG